MMGRRARPLLIIGGLIGWTGPASAQTTAPVGRAVPDPVVATVGSRTISAVELGFRYSFTPWPQRYRHGLVADRKAQFLDGLIAEKLLAGAAESRGIRLDSLSLAYLDHLEGLLLRDALYRERVAAGLVVPDTMRARAERLGATALLLDAVAVPTNQLDRARALLAAGLPLDSLAAKLPGAATDTVRYRWGQLEPSQENGLYGLRPGEVSRPLALDGRTVVVRLRDAAIVPVSSQPSAAEIDKTLSARIQADRADALVERLLGSTAYRSEPASLRPLIDVLTARLSARRGQPLTLGEGDVASLRTELRARGAQFGAVVARSGAVKLTLDEAVCSLAFGHDGFADPANLWRSVDDAVKRAVRDDLLRAEAVRLGFATRPEVRDELARWRDAALARAMRQSLAAPLPVVPAVLAAPSVVQLRELLLPDLAAVEATLRQLESGADLADLARARSLAPTAVGGGLTTWLDPARRGAVGQAALAMAPGDLYGPIRDEAGRGYWLIRLEARRQVESAAAPTDPLLLARSLAAAARVARIDSAIAALARSVPIRIDAALLAAVRVDTGDAVAERTFGFGGQSAAVPPLAPTAWRDLSSPDPLP